MGTSIGQIPATLIAAQRQAPGAESVQQTGRSNVDLTRSNTDPASTAPRNAGENSPATETPQAGFGPGTVSGPAAALVALGRGVRAVREAIPTLDEIRDQFQASRAAEAIAADLRNEAARTDAAERREGAAAGVPAADRLGFNRFNEAREFNEIGEAEPAQLASARPPEAPEFASAEQPEEGDLPPLQPQETPGSAADDVQRQRLNLTA